MVDRADDRTRTDNLLFTRQLLCRLSYAGAFGAARYLNAAFDNAYAVSDYSIFACSVKLNRRIMHLRFSPGSRAMRDGGNTALFDTPVPVCYSPRRRFIACPSAENTIRTCDALVASV